MLYSVRDITRKVRAILDNNREEKFLNSLDDTDAVATAGLIKSRIVYGISTILLKAPLSMIGEGIAFGDSVTWYQQKGHGAGYVPLPKDFLRLVAFQMSDWAQEVHAPVSVTSTEYQQQHTRFGPRGCPQRPVAALINTPDGMALEFFSCIGGEGTYVKQATYIPFPRIIKKNVYIPELLAEASFHYIAYLTAVSLKRNDEAEILLQKNETLLRDNI